MTNVSLILAKIASAKYIGYFLHNWSLSSFLAKSAQWLQKPELLLNLINCKLTAYTSHYTVFHVKERSSGGLLKERSSGGLFK